MLPFDPNDTIIHQILLAGVRRHQCPLSAIASMPYHVLHDSFLDEPWSEPYAEMIAQRKGVWDEEGTVTTNPLVEALRSRLVDTGFEIESVEVNTQGHRDFHLAGGYVLTLPYQGLTPFARQGTGRRIFEVFAGKIEGSTCQIANLMWDSGFYAVGVYHEGEVTTYLRKSGETPFTLNGVPFTVPLPLNFSDFQVMLATVPRAVQLPPNHVRTILGLPDTID